MKTISIFEAKNKFSGLIADVQNKGMSYLICKNGKPVAEITGHKSRDRLKGCRNLRVKVKGRLFDDNMSEDWECLQ